MASKATRVRSKNACRRYKFPENRSIGTVDRKVVEKDTKIMRHTRRKAPTINHRIAVFIHQSSVITNSRHKQSSFIKPRGGTTCVMKTADIADSTSPVLELSQSVLDALLVSASHFHSLVGASTTNNNAELRNNEANAIPSGDVEGLLFGHAVAQPIDQPCKNKRLRRRWKVSRAHVTGHPFAFYDITCQLHEETLQRCQMQDGTASDEQLIGTFSFRRGMPLQPTIRERAVFYAVDDHLRGSQFTCANDFNKRIHGRTILNRINEDSFEESGAVLLVMNDASEFAGHEGLGCRAYATTEAESMARSPASCDCGDVDNTIVRSHARRGTVRVQISTRQHRTTAATIHNDFSGPSLKGPGSIDVNEKEKEAETGKTDHVIQLRRMLEATRDAAKEKAKQLRLLESQAEELAAQLAALGQKQFSH